METNDFVKEVYELNIDVLSGKCYFEDIKSSYKRKIATIEEEMDKGAFTRLLKDLYLEGIEYCDKREGSLSNFFDDRQDFSSGLYDIISPNLVINEATRLCDKSSLKEGEHDEEIKLVKLYFLNIAITELDESLDCSDTTKQRLDLFLWEIPRFFSSIRNKGTLAWEENKQTANNIGVILEDKVEFLKQKIRVRRFLSAHKNGFSYQDCNHLINFPNQRSLGKKIVSRDKNCFSALFEKVKVQYLEGQASYCSIPISKVQGSQNDYELKKIWNSEEPDIESVLNWNRYLRKQLNENTLNLAGAAQEIKQVLNILSKNATKTIEDGKKVQDSAYTDQTTPIDRDANGTLLLYKAFTFRSVQNLLFNTYVRVLLKQEAKNNFGACLKDLSDNRINDISFVRMIQNLIGETQRETKIKDYYPYQYVLKFLQAFIDLIRDDVLQAFKIDRSTLEDKNEKEYAEFTRKKLQIINNQYEETIKDFKRNFKWSKERALNPVYIGKANSIISYPQYDSKINLYLDSAHILPDDYGKLEENWYAEDQYRQVTLRSVKNRVQFELHRIVTENSVDKKKEEFEKKVKDNEIKIVQVIAMFISVAIFMISNVKIFEDRTLNGSLAIMFAFSACLLMFNAFFKWLVVGFIGANVELPNEKGFFAKYKYSLSDGVLLAFITSFAMLSIFFNIQDDNRFTSNAMREINPIIVRATNDRLDSLRNNMNKEIKANIEYYKDTIQFDKRTEQKIRVMVDSSALKKP